MKRLLLASTIAASWVSLAPIAAPDAHAAGPAVAPRGSCVSLTGLALPNTQILSATQKATYCNVIGVIGKRVSTQDPDHFTYGIGFALNLPNTWHGRFEMMGGGGTDGTLNTDPAGSAGVELGQGWAVAADDGGHEDNAATAIGGYQDDDANAGGSAHFAIDHQARIDYGYNAIEKTATISKMIIADYYGRPTNFSYIMGCSNGGRDAMVASQKFPRLFDGIVAQNPGFNLPQAGIAEAWNEQALAPLATTTDVNGQPFVADTFAPQDLQVGIGGDPERLRCAGWPRRWHRRQLPCLHEQEGVPGVGCLHLRHGHTRQHPSRGDLPHQCSGRGVEEDLRRPRELEGATALFELVLGRRNLGIRRLRRGRAGGSGMSSPRRYRT